MKTFFNLPSAAAFDFVRPKITIGTFDGFHRGHLAVLRALIDWARSSDSQAVVLTFDRPPRSVISAGKKCAGQVMSLEHRLMMFDRLGINVVLALEFNSELARQEPEDFVKDTIINRLHASGVLIGHDTRFGRNGRGDCAMMQRMGNELKFQTCCAPVIELDGAPISSTRLRQAISAGNLELAERMLGRKVSVYGTVVQGAGFGRILGFPTANLDLHHEVRPPQGVYVTKTIVGETTYASVTNIGRPPAMQQTPSPSREVMVESHILDFSGALYGRNLEVQFIERLRAEESFTSSEALAKKIAEDVQEARRRLALAKSLEESVK